MPVYGLTKELLFPPTSEAEEDGLLAVGGDLRPERLLLAYSQGIFPWYSEGTPIMWYSPTPRMILQPENIRVNRSLRKVMRKTPYEVRFDTSFRKVMLSCARTRRPGQDGTWITHDMLNAYTRLHEEGFAHCAETWHEGKLVGGVYGLSIGRGFFGESMFSHANDASKIAFVSLSKQLQRWSFNLIDCQIHTDHLKHFGATLWPREQFLNALDQALQFETRRGPWSLDEDLSQAPFGQPSV